MRFLRGSGILISFEAVSTTLFADFGKGWSGIWLNAERRLEGRVAVAEGAGRDESLGLSAGADAALAASLGLTGADNAESRGLAGGALL